MSKFIKSVPTHLWNFCLDVKDMIIRDIIAMYRLIMGLNPLVRVGIIVAVIVVMLIMNAPMAFILKLTKVVAILMPLVFFVAIGSMLFAGLRTSSDFADIGDTVHGDLQYQKANIGHGISSTTTRLFGIAPDPAFSIEGTCTESIEG